MSRKRAQHEIEATASRLFLELDHDAEKVFESLFGAGPGPGATRMHRKDFVELWRRNWEEPPKPEWRADELDRFAPRDPKTGARPEEGLKAWNALLKEAFPMGRPADPPPPPPPSEAMPPMDPMAAMNPMAPQPEMGAPIGTAPPPEATMPLPPPPPAPPV